jgi:hypothetical protein
MQIEGVRLIPVGHIEHDDYLIAENHNYMIVEVDDGYELMRLPVPSAPDNIHWVWVAEWVGVFRAETLELVVRAYKMATTA